MSLIDKVLPYAKKHFPDLKVKYKDQSSFMKLLGTIMFFNKEFMTRYTTTIGSTIYFPSENSVDNKQHSVYMTLFHELVHIWDSKQNKLFKLLYLFPQILTLLLIPLLFIFSWKIIVPLMVLFALPLPAYFRMKYEKRAYFISLYTMNRLGKKYRSYRVLDEYKKSCLENFKTANYYYMWTLPNIDKEFDEAVKLIKNGGKPLDGEIMEIIDDLIPRMF